jgi:hypothetical protein
MTDPYPKKKTKAESEVVSTVGTLLGDLVDDLEKDNVASRGEQDASMDERVECHVYSSDEEEDFLTPYLDTEEEKDFLTPHLDTELPDQLPTNLTTHSKPATAPGLTTTSLPNDSDDDGDMEEVYIPPYPLHRQMESTENPNDAGAQKIREVGMEVVMQQQGEVEEEEEEDFLMKALMEDASENANALPPSPPLPQRFVGAVDNRKDVDGAIKPKSNKKAKASEKGKEKELQEKKSSKKSTPKEEVKPKKKEKTAAKVKASTPARKERKESTQKVPPNEASTSKQTSVSNARVGQVVAKAVTTSPSAAGPSASARPSAVKKKQEGLSSDAASRPPSSYPRFKKHKTTDASSNVSNSGSSSGASRTTSSSARQLPPPPSHLPAKPSPAVAYSSLRRDSSASTANVARPTLPRVNSLPPKPTWATNTHPQGSHRTAMATGALSRTSNPSRPYQPPRDRENVSASHRITTRDSQCKASSTATIQSAFSSQSATVFSRTGLAKAKASAPSSAPSAMSKPGGIERESGKPTDTEILSARPSTRPVAALPPSPVKKDEQANADSTSTEHNQALPAVQAPLPTQALKRKISLADYVKAKRERQDQG